MLSTYLDAPRLRSCGGGMDAAAGGGASSDGSEKTPNRFFCGVVAPESFVWEPLQWQKPGTQMPGAE